MLNHQASITKHVKRKSGGSLLGESRVNTNFGNIVLPRKTVNGIFPVIQTTSTEMTMFTETSTNSFLLIPDKFKRLNLEHINEEDEPLHSH
jgi:hypothetical protein